MSAEVDPLYLKTGPVTFCPWCYELVRTLQRDGHLRECDQRPSWLALLPNLKGDDVTYEATIRVYAPHGLSDEQQRAWGDVMEHFENEVSEALIGVGAVFQIETHGPAASLDVPEPTKETR